MMGVIVFLLVLVAGTMTIAILMNRSHDKPKAKLKDHTHYCKTYLDGNECVCGYDEQEQQAS